MKIENNQIFKIEVIVDINKVFDKFTGMGKKSFDNSLRLAKNIAFAVKGKVYVSIRTTHE